MATLSQEPEDSEKRARRLAAKRRWYQKHRVSILAKMKARIESSPELKAKKATYYKQWAKKNRGKLNAYLLGYYYKNHSRLKKFHLDCWRRKREQLPEAERRRLATEANIRWRKKHPLHAQIKLFIRNCKKRDPSTALDSRAVIAKLQYYGMRCVYCGSHEDLVVDHVKPLKAGGNSFLCNLVPACGYCNGKKSDRWSGPHIWLRSRDWGMRSVPISPVQEPTPRPGDGIVQSSGKPE